MVTSGSIAGNSPESVWDVPDVARFLKVSEKTVRNRVADGTIPYRRIGRLVRFDPAEIREWFNEQGEASKDGAI